MICSIAGAIDRCKTRDNSPQLTAKIPVPKSPRLPTSPPGVQNPRLIAKVLWKRTEIRIFSEFDRPDSQVFSECQNPHAYPQARRGFKTPVS
ncbi:MAG: hypothetical protein HC789_08090 [Microcoleus sp. CSU_2_2]|nr:hypothetical protein [Microcoleus sp. CSU_2_2]